MPCCRLPHPPAPPKLVLTHSLPVPAPNTCSRGLPIARSNSLGGRTVPTRRMARSIAFSSRRWAASAALQRLWRVGLKAWGL